MPLPNFTADERFVINFVQSRAASSANGYMIGYIAGGLLLGGFAIYHDSIPLMLLAFLIVCGFRLYEEWYQYRFISVWRSVIQKYETALTEGQRNDGGERNI